MSTLRRWLLLLTSVGMVSLSGASCPWLVQRYPGAGLPRARPPSPSLEQVIEVVNRNNSQIHAFNTSQAALSGAGFPTLRANVAFERPGRFRLRADLLTATEIDVGSNEELFWVWIKRNPTRGVFFCRRDQFAGSRMRQMVPIEPDWLVEAFGVNEIDPRLPHQGPFPLDGNRLEIRTIRETPQGPTTKVTILDAARGWILEQRLHDAQGRMIASSVTSQHRQDPLTGLFMPSQVSINCPAAQFSMRLDLGKVRINQPVGDPQQLWAMPSYQGYPPVDLCDPNLELAPASAKYSARASRQSGMAGPPSRW